MPGFTEIFGGGTIYPSEPTYLSLDIDDDITLEWPIEQAVSGNVVAKIIDVMASVAGLTVTIPDARQVSTGYTSMFNNVGAETVTVVNAIGGTIISLTSGTAWTIYLTDNSTEAGTWKAFQQGASTSVADAAALAGAGLVAILTTLNERMSVITHSSNYVIVDADRAEIQEWIGGSGTFTLPAPATVGNGWFTVAKNLGSGDLTVSPTSGSVDDAASLTLAAGTSAFLVCDGSDFLTVGLGSSTSGSSFGFIEIDVTGSGNYTLAGAELNQIGYRFVGVLSGTRNIIVPTAVQQYWVNNETSGAFSLFVKTAAQITGIEILQGDSNILYCDGTDIVSAESSTVSFPIPINQGGTNATTAATARTNLGATAVGSNLFTAASAAAALAVVGGAAAATTLTAGTGLTGGGDLSANRSFAVDTALVPLLASANTFTAVFAATAPAIKISAATPLMEFNETDAAANNRLWRVYASGEQFSIDAANDADNSATQFLAVDRTGTTVDTVNFPNGTLQYGGVEVGYRNLPRNIQSVDYSFALTDRGGFVYHASASPHAYTIPANATTAFPVGSVILVLNGPLSGTLSITPAVGVTLRWAGQATATVGTRTLGINSWATVLKTDTNDWIVSGVGIG